jgi:O-antigen ligase/Tfp pilus assembly protein PilF
MIIAVVTGLVGVDFWRSFWSTQERSLGIFTLFHLAALALVISSLKKEIPKFWLLYASLLSAATVSVLALLQLKIPNLLLTESINRPGATFGNPTFLAGYLLINIFIAAYCLIHSFKFSSRPAFSPLIWCLGGSLGLMIITIFATQTRGDILGLAVGMVVLLFLFAFHPPLSSGLASRRYFYGVLVLAFFLAALGFWLTRQAIIWKLVPGLDRFQNLSLSSAEIEPRLFAYRAAWNGFKDRPLLGWGWENFNVVSNKYYEPELLEHNYMETRFDKPHNVFLEYLIAGGIFFLLTYLVLFVVFIWEAFRGMERLLGQIAVAASVGYATRSMFVFETLGPLLIAYVLFGLIDGVYQETKKQLPEKTKLVSGRTVRQSLLWAGVAVGLVSVYGSFVIPIQATYYQFWGFHLFVRNKPEAAIRSFERAIAFPTPYRWNIQRDYAVAVVQAYFYNQGSVSQEAVRRAIQGMEEVASEHSFDAYNHYALVDMYNEASDVDASYSDRAEKQAALALELSPNRQQVLFSLAKTKTLKKENAEALKILKQALDLDPKVPDAHFYYGLVAHVSGEKDIAYQELRKAIAMGRPWKNFSEPLVVGNFFADEGHLDDAIQVYKEAKSMAPDNLEIMAKLGAAYYFSGKRDLAKSEFEKIMEKIDIRAAPGYAELLPILRSLGLE